MNKNKLLAAISLCVLTLFSGFSIRFVGSLFVGDVIVCLLAFGLLIYAVSSRLRAPHWILFVLCSLPIFGVFFDVINGIPMDDLFRGGARNGVFCLSILCGFYLVVCCGIRVAQWWQASLMVALFFFYLATGQVLGFPVTIIGKVMGGAAVIYFLMVALHGFILIQIAAALAISLLCFFVFDMRGVGVIWFAASSVFLFCVIRPKLIYRFYLPLFLLAACAIALSGMYLYSNSDSGEFSRRRELSNNQRLDMMADAWAGYINKPLIGNGSWQHARTYVDANDPGVEVGVHSYVVQFAYEYGTIGLLYGVSLLFAVFYSFRSLLLFRASGSVDPSAFFLLTYTAIYVLAALLNNGFSGYGRLNYGCALGMLVAYASASPYLVKRTNSKGR